MSTRGGRWLRTGGAIVAMIAIGAMAWKSLLWRAPPSLQEGGTTAPSDASRPDAGALEVEFDGCKEVLRGGDCVATKGAEVRLFIPGSPGAKFRVHASAQLLDVGRSEWSDGVTLRVVLPEGADRLLVEAGEGDAGASWKLRLVPALPDPGPIAAAIAAQREGHLEEAAELLRGLRDKGGDTQSAAVAMLARVDFKQGAIDDSIAHYHEAIALHAAEGHTGLAADDAFALAFLLMERRRFSEARELLDEARRLAEGWPLGTVLGSYYLSYLDSLTGDLRSALRLARPVESRAARLGAKKVRRMATELEALELLEVGRSREAASALEALLRSDGTEMDPCVRATLMDNLAWGLLLADETETPDGGASDPVPLLQEALAIYQGHCPDPNQIANLLENVALADLRRGRLEKAQEALSTAKSVARAPAVPVVLFALHLEGQIALARGKATAALPVFRHEEQVADAYGTTQDRYLALVDQAEAQVARGKSEEALTALATADRLVDESAAFVPIGEGRQVFFATHDRSAQLRVRLLLERHREREAMTVGRHARARLLLALRAANSLEHLGDGARKRWEDLLASYRAARATTDSQAAHAWMVSARDLEAATQRRKAGFRAAQAVLDDALAVLALPRDSRVALSKLEPRELDLFYFPVGKRWAGFARTDEAVQATYLPAAPEEHLDGERLAGALFAPFDALIERASRVHVLLYGSLRTVPVHALPWHGQPLLEHAVLDYSLDLGPAPMSDDPEHPLALLVGDTTGDLPAAREELRQVAIALESGGGWRQERLVGLDADAARVRAALGRAQLFHYAGHAAFGGADGIDSTLPLARHGELSAGDVLALPRTPNFVSLFGCNTGTESETGSLEALGLANAFLAAGSRAVVATSRTVDDALAADVAGEYYRHLLEGGPIDPSAALRAALLSVRQKRPDADWAAFRAIVR